MYFLAVIAGNLHPTLTMQFDSLGFINLSVSYSNLRFGDDTYKATLKIRTYISESFIHIVRVCAHPKPSGQQEEMQESGRNETDSCTVHVSRTKDKNKIGQQ